MAEFKNRVEIHDVSCIKDTPNAICCEHEDWDKAEWFPLSQVDDDSEVYAEGHSGTLIISQWIASERGVG